MTILEGELSILNMDPATDGVPPGWKRFIHNGRVVYSTPPPFVYQIRRKSDLVNLHNKDLFRDVSENQLVFTVKRKSKEQNFTYEKITCSLHQKVVTPLNTNFNESIR